MRRFSSAALLLCVCFSCRISPAQDKIGKLPHVEFDVAKRQVRVECEALNIHAPLEFFCCETGTNEHESVLRTSARPSNIQVGLIAIGLKPGQPITYSEALNKWIPPQGPPLHISVEFQKNGKTVTYPAYRWMRNVKTKKEPAAFTWVYTGSRTMPDGKFAADVTGYVVSIVNFDLTLVDVPQLASSDNETLEWEPNLDLMPKTGTKVWMIIEPAGKPAKAAKPTEKTGASPAGSAQKGAQSNAGTAPLPGSEVAAVGPVNAIGTGAPARPVRTVEAPTATRTGRPAGTVGSANTKHAKPASTAPADEHLSDVHIDEQKVKSLEKYWQTKVGPHENALREAAQAHYEVIASLRREQQRLIDEADRIQRAIDKLEKEYQDMTTPRPEAN